MLSNISIVNYKSIESYKFDLSKLNLLTGANSTGKSSVIQALLLLSDNIQEHGAQKGLVSRHSPIYAFSEVRNYIQNANNNLVNLWFIEWSFFKSKDRFSVFSILTFIDKFIKRC